MVLHEEEKRILRKLAQKGYTPAYVYFERILEERLNFINKLLSGKNNFYFLFALLANNNPHLLSAIIEKGGEKFKGFICSSYEEFSLIMSLPNLKEGMFIDYHDPIMDEEILYKIKFFRRSMEENNIKLFITVNSFYQYTLVKRVFKDMIGHENGKPGPVSIFLRVSLDTKDGKDFTYFNYHGKYARFGIEEFDSVMEDVNDFKIGLHIYPGTNIVSKEYYKNIIDLLYEKYEKYKEKIFAIDFGGGFGVNYDKCKPDDNLITEAVEYINEKFKNSNLIKIIEPGRSIIAPAGVLLSRVKDKKIRDGILFLTVDSGFPNFARPYIYEQFHKVEILSDNNEFKETPVLIGGFSMASQDFVYGEFENNKDCKGISPVKPKVMKVPTNLLNIKSPEEGIGTPVIIYCTGAYGYNMASRFSGRPKPMEIFISKSGKPYIIRRAESEDGLLSGIIGVPEEVMV